MKNALILITTLLITFTSYADTYIGLNYAVSKPSGYNECPCPPDFELKPIRAEFDAPSFVLRLGYEFNNGMFVEGRHGRGLKKSSSEIFIKDGANFTGIDVKLEHFTYVGLGYSFMQDKAFSPYVIVGRLMNWQMAGFSPATGEQIASENYGNTSYGAGVNWNFSEHWTANLDYQNYSRGDWGKDGGLDFSAFSAGVSYRF